MNLRALLIVATMLLGGMLLSGMALAAHRACGPQNPCNGTNSHDKLTGDASQNQINGFGGQDVIKANKGDDWLNGGKRDDLLYGGDGEDHLDGGRGSDVAYGQGGNDTFHSCKPSCHQGDPRAAYKPDEADEGRRADKLVGGPGMDTFNTRDGKRDVIECGPGKDTAFVDQFDTFAKNCENVIPDGPVDPPPVVTIDKADFDHPNGLPNLSPPAPPGDPVDEDGRVAFEYHANEISTFWCQLTKIGSPAPVFSGECGSNANHGSIVYSELSVDRYQFEIYAVDQASNRGEAVSKTFSVCIDGICSGSLKAVDRRVPVEGKGRHYLSRSRL